MLLSIKSLERYLEAEIKTEVLAKKEGGVEAIYVILIAAATTATTAATVIAVPVLKKLAEAWAANFFRPKIHATEEAKNKIDVAKSRLEFMDKIKKGNYTQEEYDYAASIDKGLMKLKSNFYSSASKVNEITKIESSIDKNPAVTINYNEFYLNIINSAPTVEKKQILNATIHIVSPILVKIPNSKQKWRGIYSGFPIDFSINDKDFLKQVESKEVKFEYGTKIGCNIEITTKSKLDEVGEHVEEYHYIVTDVLR
jgi:hypothetical protein